MDISIDDDAGSSVVMNIRPYEDCDTERVAAIVRDATEELRMRYRPAGRTEDTDTIFGWSRYVIDWNGGAAGVVEIAVVNNGAQIRGLAVGRAYRRRGLARILLTFCVNRAAQAGARKLTLYTIKETGNVDIFEKLGFSVVREDVARGYVGVDGKPVYQVRMERDISQV